MSVSWSRSQESAVSNAVIHVGLDRFATEVVEASRRAPVLVDFWADWCGPCKALGPVLDRIAESMAGRLTVAKVDTEAEGELAAQFNIRSIPAVMLFKDGRVVAQFVGAQPEPAIRQWLAPHLPPAADSPLAQARDAWRRGEGAAARALLEPVLELDPADHDARELLAEVVLASGDATTTRQLLDALPPDRQFTPAVTAIKARLYFADELATVADGTSDLDDLYARALKSAAAGRLDDAAEALLALTERSRAYRDDAGRRGLLQVFELTPDAPGIGDYRRRLARLLH
jgi:putative thioredoxin